MNTTPESVVRSYYTALRNGDPLAPYFLDDESTVKFGISESLYGFEAVADALADQTETTDDWTVESTALLVDDCGEYATIADTVTMAWANAETGDRRQFETRWSGTLVATDDDTPGPAWLFTTMHVSVSQTV